MSRPGDPDRTIAWVEGFDETVVKAVELVHTVPGAHSFELRYEAQGRDLAEGEDPGPEDTVLWSASAQIRRRYYPGAPKVTRTITGTSTVLPGGSHYHGIVLACVAMLEKLGVNVVLLDGLTGDAR